MRALRLYTAAFYAFMFTPLVVVVLFSFNSIRSLQNFDGFSFQWYRAFWDNESLRGSLIASLEIALATMIVATVLGTLLFLTTLGLAVGISAADPDSADPSALGTGAAIWSGLALLIALFIGGMAYPLDELPTVLEEIAKVLPAAALSESVRGALTPGVGVPGWSIVVLALWAIGAPLVAARYFRWEE